MKQCNYENLLKKYTINEVIFDIIQFTNLKPSNSEIKYNICRSRSKRILKNAI